MSSEQGILLANAAATLVMAGISWYVHIVQYPLFRMVNPENFPLYMLGQS